MQNAARTYFETKINTTTQGDLLILLFDGAIKYLNQAKEKIAERNYAQKGILISKALDILTELQGSLNAQKGGELAGNLQRLYFYCSTQLLQANLKMDVGLIDEVIRILDGLRDAFSQANQQVGAQNMAPPPLAPTPRPAMAAKSSPPAAAPGAAIKNASLNVYAMPNRARAPQAPAAPVAGPRPAAPKIPAGVYGLKPAAPAAPQAAQPGSASPDASSPEAAAAPRSPETAAATAAPAATTPPAAPAPTAPPSLARKGFSAYANARKAPIEG